MSSPQGEEDGAAGRSHQYSLEFSSAEWSLSIRGNGEMVNYDGSGDVVDKFPGRDATNTYGCGDHTQTGGFSATSVLMLCWPTSYPYLGKNQFGGQYKGARVAIWVDHWFIPHLLRVPRTFSYTSR